MSYVQHFDGIAVTLARGVASHFRIRATAWFMAFAMLNLGIALHSYPRLFGDFDKVFLLNQVEHQTWSGVCVAIAVAQLLALLINGSFPRLRFTPYIRAVTSAMATLIWTQVAFGANISEVPNILMVVSPVLVAMEFYNTVIAAIEMRL